MPWSPESIGSFVKRVTALVAHAAPSLTATVSNVGDGLRLAAERGPELVVFDGSMEGGLDRSLPAFTAFVAGMKDAVEQGRATYANIRREQPPGIAFSLHFPYPPNTLGAGAAGTPLFSAAALLWESMADDPAPS